MEEISVEAISQAVNQFYHCPAVRDKAHSWLESFQASREAWQFCWLLLSPDKPLEVQFYGAATLHNKVFKYWHEIAPEDVEKVHNRLMNTILQYSSNPNGRLIATKLCLVLSGVILHTITEKWPDAVSQVIAAFQSCETIAAEERCRLLLEVLTGLTDEFKHANYGVRSGQGSATYLKVMQQFDHIRQLITPLISLEVPEIVQIAALKCMISWNGFGVKLDQLEELLEKTFHCLLNTYESELLVDALVMAFTSHEPSQYPRTIKKYFMEVLKLFPRWQKEFEEENMDWCKDISRLVIGMAEENISLIAKLFVGDEADQQLCLNVVGMILHFTNVKGNFPVDETLSEISFGFWYILQEITQTASAQEHAAHYLKLLTPVYINLVHVLLRKAQYPDDSVYKSMNGDEKEIFRCYRQDIADTIMYAHCILFDNLALLLKSCVMDVTCRLPDVRWQEVESILYILSNVIDVSLSEDEEEWEINEYTDRLTKTPDTKEDIMLVEVINLISKLNLDHEILLISVLQVIGAFSEKYEQKPELLSVVFPIILLKGLNSAETVLFATSALKDICKDNNKLIEPYSDDIISVCHQKISSNTLSSRDAARLFSCVGHVLSTLPQDRIHQWLEKLLPPITYSLHQAASLSPSGPVKLQLMDKIQMLTFLFDSLDVCKYEDKTASHDSQPVLAIMKDMIPVLNLILSHWAADSEIVGCILELIKKCIRTLLEGFKCLLEEVCVMISKIYEHQQHHTVMEIIRQLVLIFMKDPAAVEIVKETFHFTARKTIDSLKQDTHGKTDLLESYMNLCVQMSKKSSDVLADKDFPFDDVFEMAVRGILLPEYLTVKACCSFLTDVITKKAKYTRLDVLVPNIATFLYDSLLKCVGGYSPRGNELHVTTVFLAMNLSYLPIATQTMQLLLNQENYPVPQVTADDKLRFIKDVIKERSSKRRLQEIITTFSMICRGIAGTAYAQQTALSMQFR